MDDATSGWRMKSLSIKIILLNFPPNSHMRKDEQPRNGWFAKKKIISKKSKIDLWVVVQVLMIFSPFFLQKQ